MSPLPILLVAISTVTHAYWNFLVKRAGGTQAFLALSKLAEIAIFLPVAVFLMIQSSAPLLPYWWLIAGAALITTVYYALLGRAYGLGNLSLVYPVARAGALVFLPLLAYVFVGERIDWLGGAAIGLIIAGIFILQLESLDRAAVAALLAGVSQPAMGYAIIAAFLAACYAVWDKVAVQLLPVFIYYYVYTAISAIGYCLVVVIRSSRQTLIDAFKQHPSEIVQVGFFNTFTYVLVLIAIQTDKASYVIALRQMSIGLGALMGRFWLNEKFSGHRWAGLAMLLGGCILVALAK